MRRALFTVTVLLLAVGAATPALGEEAPPPATGEADGARPSDAVDGPAAAEEGGGGEEVGEGEEAPPPPPVPEPEEVRLARVHFETGIRLVRRERWLAALAEFDASLELHPTRAARLNRGLCLYHLDRFMEALAALRDYLDRYGDEIDDAQRRQVQAMMDDVRALLTEVEVHANVEGAAVSVDHIDVGRTPLLGPLLLMSGPHEIEVRLAGYEPARREVVVVAGRAMVETFELVELRRRGRIRVESNAADAVVLVGGHEVGSVPWEGELPAGPQELEVRADGYRPGRQLVTVEPGGRVQAMVSLLPERGAHRGWFWSALGLAAVATAATVSLGTTALVLDGSYDPDDLDAEERYREGQALMVGTDVALGVAVAAAAAALVLAFFTDWSGSAEAE